MRNHDIIIASGTPTDEKLVIQGGDEIFVNVYDTVSWSIKSGSNVDSFKIRKKRWSPKIFREDDPIDFGRKLDRQVKCDASDKIYSYSIHWKVENHQGHPYIYDPKITVMPTGFASNKLLITLFSVFSVLFAFFLGLFSIQLLRRKKNRK